MTDLYFQENSLSAGLTTQLMAALNNSASKDNLEKVRLSLSCDLIETESCELVA